MDETGLSTVSNKIPKVVSVKGKRAVGKVTSAERGSLVTAIACSSASGTYVPPTLIFPRKREKPELLDGAPPGSKMYISDSGYSNGEIFIKWLEHFKDSVHPSETNPILLILDNHLSHVSLEAVEFCRENYISMLTIPPHSSHRLQPLDRTFFGALKASYARESDLWLARNPGRVITHYQIAGIFCSAYLTTATMKTSVKGFKECGICPFDRNIFSEVDFLPSSVTDQSQDNELIDDPDEPLPFSPNPVQTSPEKQLVEIAPPGEPIYILPKEQPVPSSSNSSKIAPNLIQTSHTDTEVSPSDILPIPKIKVSFFRRCS